MPLETATYISDLVASNPASSDPMNYADDHMRLVKGALKATFPNITGAVTATHTQLNGIAGWATGGAPLLVGAGTYFNVNTTDGFQNTLAGDIDIVLQGNIAATFQRAGGVNTLKTFGGITSTGLIQGPGVAPIGATMLWWTDTLPSDGLWAWCNGQWANRAAYPQLFALWGTRFGNGDGSGATFTFPDLRETVPIGKSTMGGVGARGAIGQYTQAQLNALNGVVGEAMHVLTGQELPAHRHTAQIYDPGHAHTYSETFANGSGVTGGGAFAEPNAERTSNTSSVSTGVVLQSGDGYNNLTGISGNSAAHNVIQLSTVCNWIVRAG